MTSPSPPSWQSQSWSPRPVSFRWSGTDDERDGGSSQQRRIDRIQNGVEGFNDLPFYVDLTRQDGCVRVDLHRVLCRHHTYVLGLQSLYRCYFRDGTTRDRWAPAHFFQRGYYYYRNGGHRTVRESILELSLDDRECLSGITVNQGEIVDGIRFVTNKGRAVSFGGTGGSRIDLLSQRTRCRHQRVVAFAGTDKGILERIGYFAVEDAWSTRGPLVMLRCLVERGRATFRPAMPWISRDQTVVRALVRLEAEDVWRHVILYL